jgi:arylsulfatase
LTRCRRYRNERNRLPLCRGEQVPNWRDAVEIESYNNVRALSTDCWARTIRTRDWRYTLYPLNTGEQLFSMKTDPDEQKNLAGDPGYARVRTEMRDRLLEQIIMQDHPHTQRDRFGLGII